MQVGDVMYCEQLDLQVKVDFSAAKLWFMNQNHRWRLEDFTYITYTTNANDQIDGLILIQENVAREV